MLVDAIRPQDSLSQRLGALLRGVSWAWLVPRAAPRPATRRPPSAPPCPETLFLAAREGRPGLYPKYGFEPTSRTRLR